MPFGKRPDFGDARYAGAETVFACDIVDALQVGCSAFLKANNIVLYQVCRKRREFCPKSCTETARSRLVQLRLQCTMHLRS